MADAINGKQLGTPEPTVRLPCPRCGHELELQRKGPQHYVSTESSDHYESFDADRSEYARHVLSEGLVNDLYEGCKFTLVRDTCKNPDCNYVGTWGVIVEHGDQ